MEADEDPRTALPVAVYDRRLPVPRLEQFFEGQHALSIRSQAHLQFKKRASSTASHSSTRGLRGRALTPASLNLTRVGLATHSLLLPES
jgi:hypothetical protein